MRQAFFLVCFSYFFTQLSLNRALAQHQVNLPEIWKSEVEKKLKPFFSVSSGKSEVLLKGEVVSEGEVTSPSEKEQKLELWIAGIHPRNCTRAMRKLSLYENYSQYMDFIKTSQYQENLQKFSFVIDHKLLPFPMIVSFRIPRMTQKGHYTFVFEEGFLKDLKGTVIIEEMGKYCLLALKTDWQGPKTKIPNLVFETFLQTVGKIGLEHLIRVSVF